MPPQCERGTTRAIYVVHTAAVDASGTRRGITHYEIHVAPEPNQEAPRVSLITTDRRMYDLALAAEDHARCFTATWHRISTKFGSRYLIDRFDEKA